MSFGRLLKKEKTLKRAGTFELENGDCYLICTAVRRGFYLFAAFSVGKMGATDLFGYGAKTC